MNNVKPCKTCKHFKARKWAFNLWGLIKDDDYYDLAECLLGTPDGRVEFCFVARDRDWHKAIVLCNMAGRCWEAKESD